MSKKYKAVSYMFAITTAQVGGIGISNESLYWHNLQKSKKLQTWHYKSNREKVNLMHQSCSFAISSPGRLARLAELAAVQQLTS